jgi:hypothetical protein
MNCNVNRIVSFLGILLMTISAGAAEPGLVGWWRLDDGVGTTAADSSDGGHSGSFTTGNPIWGQGKFGGALKFDGGGPVEIPDHADFHLTDAVSIALWANPEAVQETDAKFFCKQKSSTYPYALQYNAATQTIYANVTASSQLNTKPNLDNFPGQWAHLCCVYDGSALILYKDGVEVARATGSGKLAQNTLTLTIGGRSTYTTSNNFKGLIDDVRLYNRALTPQDIQRIMQGPAAAEASQPNPAAGAVDVPRDVVLSWKPAAPGMAHDVYFGTVGADVAGASRTSPKGVLAGQAQDANTYDPPGLLPLGQAYYWRVDEVNTITNTIGKGLVWSFTTEPVAYAIKPVAVTASSSQSLDNGPEKTIDGSGLNAADQHSILDTTMWISGAEAALPAWIRYDLGQSCKLYQMWVWNSNQPVEPTIGFGAKDVTVQYSSDGTTWTTLPAVSRLARATGKADYTHNTTVDFNGAVARYVKITIQSNWGGLVSQCSLSEVRFFSKLVQASNPQPAPGKTGVAPDVVLSWRAGREAVTHQVYFGTDPNALTLAGTTTAGSFVPPAVRLGATYYWRVDEVNAAETPSFWTGPVWSFSTQDYLVVDDFESYNDKDNALFDTWLDNYDPQAAVQHGALVGNDKSVNGTYGETTIIHGGKQSMPLHYDNAGAKYVVSETTRTWSSAQDWTAYGANTLSLWFRGQPTGFLALAADHVLMSGTGIDIFNAADQGRFVYKQLSGNGSIIARVDRLDNVNEWAKAGVMIRETLDPGSTWAYSLASVSHGVRFQARLLTGGNATSDSVLPTLPAGQTSAPIPMWVKVERVGNVFNAYYSSDGITWTPNPWNPQTITMRTNVYIGLAVTSHTATAVTQAEFSSISVTGNVTGDWQSADLGITQPVGNTPDRLYLTVKDANAKSVTQKHPDASAVLVGSWQQWKIPFGDLTGVNPARIKTLILGIGDATAPQHGVGTLYLDDIAVGRPAQ